MDELYVLYFSPNTIWVINSRTMSWAGNVERMSERMDEDRVSVGKTEGKRPQERPRLRLEVNIEMIFQEVGMIDLAEDRDSECGNETSGSVKCGEFVDWLRTG